MRCVCSTLSIYSNYQRYAHFYSSSRLHGRFAHGGFVLFLRSKGGDHGENRSTRDANFGSGTREDALAPGGGPDQR